MDSWGDILAPAVSACWNITGSRDEGRMNIGPSTRCDSRLLRAGATNFSCNHLGSLCTSIYISPSLFLRPPVIHVNARCRCVRLFWRILARTTWTVPVRWPWSRTSVSSWGAWPPRTAAPPRWGPWGASLWRSLGHSSPKILLVVVKKHVKMIQLHCTINVYLSSITTLSSLHRAWHQLRAYLTFCAPSFCTHLTT